MGWSVHGRSDLVLLLVLLASFYVNSPLAAAASSATAGSSLPLAAEQTRRKDPLDGLRYYAGGWNISDRHYMASVGFSAAPVFAAAAVWFAAFAVAALVACCRRCCRGGSDYSYSRPVFVASLVLLLVFTAAAIIGCAVLYDGQGKFHGSTTATLGYVVSQSNGAVASLREFTSFLEAAKAAGVDRVAELPPDLKGKIDEVVARVDASADELAARTSSNSRKISTALETTRKVLIGVAAVTLILAFLGLVFSLSGLDSLVRALLFFGWILVTATFILCGIFLLLHNVVGDTCMAMDEWVLRPRDYRTALDDILPCVDAAATSDALRRSKEVNHQLVAVLNGVISNVSNANNVPPQAGPPAYYNQSGPPLPLLCNPFHPDLTPRPCAAGEVAAANAPQVWQGFVCRATTTASGSEVCATAGRLTPAMYARALTVVNASDGLSRHGPAVADLADCTFVRRAFRSVSANNCPGLRRHSGSVYRALLAVSVAAMAAVAAWAVHSRERRRRRETRRFHVSPYRFPIEEKSLLKSPRRPYRRADGGSGSFIR